MIKKGIIHLVCVTIFLNACTVMDDKNENMSKYEKDTIIDVIESKEKNIYQENHRNSKQEFFIFFEDQLGYDAKKLKKGVQQDILEIYKKAYALYNQEGHATREYLQLKSETNQILRREGYEIPFMSLVDVAEYLKSDIPQDEYEELLEISDIEVENLSQEEYINIIHMADDILNPFGLSAKEIINQTDSNDLQLALYTVKKGEIYRNNLDTVVDTENSSLVEDTHQLIWNKIRNMLPPQYRNRIYRFEINTDGYDGSTAFVHSEDNVRWSISVDINDVLDTHKNFTTDGLWTIVHEISHIISLNETQMTTEKDPTLLTIKEGTLKKDSYLGQFYNIFWADLIQEHSHIQEEEQFKKFFEKYKNSFVTEYAATNPVEDFAESFAQFVIYERKKEDSVLSKKIDFFYTFPEFIKIREDMRKEL